MTVRLWVPLTQVLRARNRKSAISGAFFTASSVAKSVGTSTPLRAGRYAVCVMVVPFVSRWVVTTATLGTRPSADLPRGFRADWSRARGRRCLADRPPAARGAGGPRADAQRLPGAPVRHGKPPRAASDTGRLSRQAPADPHGRGPDRAHAPEDGGLVAGPARRGLAFRQLQGPGDPR